MLNIFRFCSVYIQRDRSQCIDQGQSSQKSRLCDRGACGDRAWRRRDSFVQKFENGGGEGFLLFLGFAPIALGGIQVGKERMQAGGGA